MISRHEEVGKRSNRRYGIIDPISVDGKLIEVKKFVVKLEAGALPSNYAIMGSYVMTSEIFGFLDGN